MDRVEQVKWRSGIDTVGIVVAVWKDGLKRAYIGMAQDLSEDIDAVYIAQFGARLSYQEAVGFFPELKSEEYGHEPF